jgi:hypothetical protein
MYAFGMTSRMTYSIFVTRFSLLDLPSQQFLLSALFARVPAAVIKDIMNHLLLERSVVVCGSSASMVSVVAAALVHLIAPLKWEGVFVPLLPISASEVLQAPVPFIIGTVNYVPIDTEEQAFAILNTNAGVRATDMFRIPVHDRTSIHMQTIDDEEVECNLKSARRFLLNSKKCSCDCKLDSLKLNIDEAQSRLYFDDRIMHILLNHILHHMASDTKSAISRSYKSIIRRNRLLLGDLSHIDRWKRYGIFDYSSGNFTI